MHNPYAPPESRGPSPEDFAFASAGDAWREDQFLVVRRGCHLPDRCVRCNAPAVVPMKSSKFYWHSPWLYLTILIGLWLYIIIALIVRQKTEVTWGLCDEHARLRKRHYLIAGGSALTAIALFFVAANVDGASALGWLGALLLVVALCWAVVGPRVLVPVRIDGGLARFKGAGPAFLYSLSR